MSQSLRLAHIAGLLWRYEEGQIMRSWKEQQGKTRYIWKIPLNFNWNNIWHSVTQLTSHQIPIKWEAGRDLLCSMSWWGAEPSFKAIFLLVSKQSGKVYSRGTKEFMMIHWCFQRCQFYQQNQAYQRYYWLARGFFPLPCNLILTVNEGGFRFWSSLLRFFFSHGKSCAS